MTVVDLLNSNSTMKASIFFVVFFCYQSVNAGVIVVPSTPENHSDQLTLSTNVTTDKPQIYKFHVDSDIKYRYSRTVVSSRVANPSNISQEVYFTAVLPDTAFISGFLMEVDGQIYKAYVREKEAARQEYTEAVRQGRTAAHVALSARDSNHFKVSLNLEPLKKVTFNLTYEELLTRKLGAYKHVINLDPGQIVQDFRVRVNIDESADIINLKVPALRTSNEINANPSTEATNPLVVIERPTTRKVNIQFAPTPQQQRDLATDGIKGQLVVQYDVDRRSNPGEILVNDGYFVHFFAPEDLPSLKKQVTFVLDVSGSMGGPKIVQLREAMTAILDDLHANDLFSIVIFSSFVKVWDYTLTTDAVRLRLLTLRERPWEREIRDVPLLPSVVATATPQNITKAKQFISELSSLGATNIHGALQKALDISKLELNTNTSNAEDNYIEQDDGEEAEQRPEPIIIFLTDGQPNVEVTNTDNIVSRITTSNTNNASIFSLALGDDADFEFLKKLSLRNSGFARKIYEASDTALQLTDFYRQVSSPLLAHVNFVYPPEQVEQTSVTKVTFRRLFSGSELVVVGRMLENNITAEVRSTASSRRVTYPFSPVLIDYIPDPPTTSNVTNTTSTMERLWAYLTIQQLLDMHKESGSTNQSSPEKQRALELALKYSFVTPLTSLVVVKPNGTAQADTRPPESVVLDQRPGSYLALTGSGGPSGRSGLVLNRHATLSSRGFMNPYNPRVRGILLAPTIVSLSDITWLPTYSSNDTISLPTGEHAAIENFQLATANQTNQAYTNCTTPLGELGHCRHFRHCVMDVFKRTVTEFIPYFCRINNFAGVCCPDYLI